MNPENDIIFLLTMLTKTSKPRLPQNFGSCKMCGNTTCTCNSVPKLHFG